MNPQFHIAISVVKKIELIKERAIEVLNNHKKGPHSTVKLPYHIYCCFTSLALQDLLKVHLNLTTFRTSFLNLDKNNMKNEINY